MVKRISFAQWMQRFAEEDTALGGLARAIKADKTFPKRSTKRSKILTYYYDSGVINFRQPFDKLWEAYTVATSGNESQKVAMVNTDRCIPTNGDGTQLEAFKQYVVRRLNVNYGIAATARDANLHNVASHYEGSYEALLYVMIELGIDGEEFTRISDIQKEETVK